MTITTVSNKHRILQVAVALAPNIADKMPNVDLKVIDSAAETVAKFLVNTWGSDSPEIGILLATPESKLQERQVEALAKLLESGVHRLLQNKACIDDFTVREETTAIGVTALARHLVYVCGYDNPDVS